MKTEGPLARQLCAFARVLADDAVLAIVPRLIAGVDGDITATLPWGDTSIIVAAEANRRSFRNVLTGERLTPEPRRGGAGALAAARVFAHFPVALLASE